MSLLIQNTLNNDADCDVGGIVDANDESDSKGEYDYSEGDGDGEFS